MITVEFVLMIFKLAIWNICYDQIHKKYLHLKTLYIKVISENCFNGCHFVKKYYFLTKLLHAYVQFVYIVKPKYQKTSDGGYGNHGVSLPIILIKIKVDHMLPSSYISLLLVFIL